jgi:hypothetical protein
MSTVTQTGTNVKPARPRKPRPKPARTVNLILAPTAPMPGIVRITVGEEPWCDYNVARIPSDFGRAFRLVKILGPHDRYDVLLNGEHSSCECKGFLRHGHCKHVDGLQALVAAGKL